MRQAAKPNSIRVFREKILQLTQLQFAELLGMGVATINRYENGAEPTAAHAHLLISLEEDPSSFMRMLAGKRKVLGEPTHARLTKIAETRLAQSALLQVKDLQRKDTSPEFTGKRAFNLERLIQMILFFTQLGEWKTKLNKLLFYSDFLSFKELGQSISGTRYVRGSYGPVPDQFQQLFAALLESSSLTAREEFSADDRPVEKLVAKLNFDRTKFSKRELAVLEFVYEFFKDKSAKQAVDLSHEESVFLNAKDGENLSYLGARTLKIQFSLLQKKTPPESLAVLARKLTAQLPESELDKLPEDGALNHDHYLYGAPKKKK